MGLVDRVNDAVRSDPVTLEEFGALLGQSNGRTTQSRSGVTVSQNRLLGVSAWYRGVRYLSETVASLPAHTYRTTPDGRQRRAAPVWQSSPGDELTWYGVIEFVMMSLLHRGNAYLFKQRGPSGQVVGLVPVHPDDVKPGVTSGRKVFLIRASTGDELPYTSREIWHVPALSNDGWFGLDPIRTFADSAGAVIAADDYAAKSFKGESRLAAYIQIPGKLDKAEAERVYEDWQKLHAGMDARRFGVIGDGAEYKTIGLDPQQTQLLESRRFGVSEVARLLGVVPHKLYDLERATFSNIEHQAIESVTDSIRPWAVRLEAWFNADRQLIPVSNFIEFELEGLLRGDTKTRYEAYSAAVGGPWLEVNAARRLENLPPIEGGDDVLQPLNMTTTEAPPEEAHDG